jgi:predicted 3-demethylubiquinone-9 3-methyltransferase (glyoxalase superfamily)
VECAWLKDKYGLSWQVVPTVMDEMMLDKDEQRRDRVMRTTLKMKKLDVAELERAYRG